jgi:hypothetical protein
MWRCVGVAGLLMLIAGCQTTHEDLIAKGYPPAFTDGFDDGCSRRIRTPLVLFARNKSPTDICRN